MARLLLRNVHLTMTTSIERVPRLDAASRVELPPVGTGRSKSRSDGTENEVSTVLAQKLLRRTQCALADRDLDDATDTAERLLELAASGKDAGVVCLVAVNTALLGRVFEARVGSLDCRLEVGIAGLEPGDLALSRPAAQLLELARGGTTVRELLAGCGFPRQHAIRMVAGLLQRRVLVAL